RAREAPPAVITPASQAIPVAVTAPVGATSAPIVPTVAPEASTAATLGSTPAPITPTVAPEASAPAPVASAPAPAAATAATDASAPAPMDASVSGVPSAPASPAPASPAPASPAAADAAPTQLAGLAPDQYGDLFDRMRAGFKLDDGTGQRAVDQQLHWYASNPDYLQRAFG